MLKEKIINYLDLSHRRKIMDAMLTKNKSYFKGNVLDIGGGRKRGTFTRPKTESWIVADSEESLHPDIICSIEKMPFDNESFDSIKATELFEHVENPERGLNECLRVLKENGVIIITVPFLAQVHADPYDYQRWTKYKWEKQLKATGFKVKEIQEMGYFFTVMADMLKILNKSIPRPLRYIGYIFYPILSILTEIDKITAIRSNQRLSKFTTGYFIIANK